MRPHPVVAFSGSAALIGLVLVGCGRSPFEPREPWRTQAEESCLAQKLVQPSSYVARAAELNGPGACGMSYPFKVAAFGDGSIALNRAATLACPVIPRIDGWLAEVVQPAAELYFGTAVAEVKAGSYSCRPRNNQRGAKLSEHSFGNALDVMGFRLADGREVSVVKGWRGATAEQDFLREVFVGACSYFTTVLGPGADPFHYDHFHVDLARHDARGERRVCKPLLKFTPRLDPQDRGAPTTRRLPRLENPRPFEPPAIDLDEDPEDPFVISDKRAGSRALVAAPSPRSREAPARETVARAPAFDPEPAGPRQTFIPRSPGPSDYDRGGLSARIAESGRFSPPARAPLPGFEREPPLRRGPALARAPREAGWEEPLALVERPRPVPRPPHPSVDDGIY